MFYKNLIVGLFFSICIFCLACEARTETGKSQISSDETDSTSSRKMEKDSAKAENIISDESAISSKTGVYELKNTDTANEFNIEELGENNLQIEFIGTYLYKVNGEEMANSGEAKGTALVENDVAKFTPEDMEDCTMMLTFRQKTLQVKDNGKCIFGLNVSAAGNYKKISEKPSFSDDEENSSEDENTSTDSKQKKVRVKFAKGKSSKTLKGRIYGYEYVDYIVGASKGQTLTVKLNSESEWAQFVVFNSNEENLEGSIGETDFTTNLPNTDDYIIRVLMPRAEARRKGSMADYSLFIKIN